MNNKKDRESQVDIRTMTVNDMVEYMHKYQGWTKDEAKETLDSLIERGFIKVGENGKMNFTTKGFISTLQVQLEAYGAKQKLN